MRPVTDLQRTVAPFRVVSEFQPAGDQPAAIEELEKRVRAGEQDVAELEGRETFPVLDLELLPLGDLFDLVELRVLLRLLDLRGVEHRLIQINNADLHLRERERGGDVDEGQLAERRPRPVRRQPLAVQRPFYPDGPGAQGGACHVYLLHPPGGVVGGDALDIVVNAGAGSRALVTTPAAGKLYRSAGSCARLSQRLVVDEDAQLEWLPQPTIAFAGVNARMSTRVDLAPGGRFIGWEIVCLGRTDSGERYAGQLHLALELWRDSAPLWLERALQGRPVRGRHDDALGNHVRRVVPAQSLQAQEPLVVYVLDEKADLVRMRRDHHPHVIAPPPRPDNAPKGIGSHLVRKVPKLLACDLALLLLPPRNPRRLDETFQQRFV